jgi:hypothetical protein
MWACCGRFTDRRADQFDWAVDRFLPIPATSLAPARRAARSAITACVDRLESSSDRGRAG